MNDNTGIIILAAGNSSRLGQPKQLLKYKDKTLLRHAVETAVATRYSGPVLVVTGSLHDELFKECNGLQASLVHNVNWQQGMASSIHTGVKALLRAKPDINGALIILCDQPSITSAHLDNLLDIFAHHQYKGIIATAYAETLGAPAVFGHGVLEQLYSLKGDKGTRDFINSYDGHVVTVPFKPAGVNINTMEDYEGLN